MKKRSASFGSFGSLRGMNYELLRDTQYSDDWTALEEETRSLDVCARRCHFYALHFFRLRAASTSRISWLAISMLSG